jgi:hypothetical protein
MNTVTIKINGTFAVTLSGPTGGIWLESVEIIDQYGEIFEIENYRTSKEMTNKLYLRNDAVEFKGNVDPRYHDLTNIVKKNTGIKDWTFSTRVRIGPSIRSSTDFNDSEELTLEFVLEDYQSNPSYQEKLHQLREHEMAIAAKHNHDLQTARAIISQLTGKQQQGTGVASGAGG